MKLKGEIGYVIWKDDVEVVFWVKVVCDKLDVFGVMLKGSGLVLEGLFEVIDCMKERVGVVFV